MTDATQLLRDYARNGSEPAFRELVTRYTDLVYSVALRRAGGDAHLAEDIVQTVFTDLATQTRGRRGPLASGPCALGGWLHRHTCFVVSNLRRAEHRREAREQLAVEMNSLDSAADASWQELAPVLDETLNELESQDRDALLLRFYERRDLRAVGQALGVSEDAAQKRVTRALDKLRGLLASRGVGVGIATLGGLLGERAVQAAPPALAGRVSRTAVAAGAGVGLGLLSGLLVTTKAKLAAGLVGAGLVALPLFWHFGGRSSSSDGADNQRAGGVGTSGVPVAVGGEARTPDDGVAVKTSAGVRLADPKTDPEALTLTFLAADTGEPVPDVAVDYWCWNGTAVDRKTLHGTHAGVCEVRFPRHTATQLQLTSQSEGFADTRLQWRPDRGEQVPFEYTLRLERAVPIGGTVVDPDGQPVAGAKVGFGHGELTDARRPENHSFSWLQVETDGEGRWEVSRIANEILGRISGSAEHPDFVRSESVEVARDPAAEPRLRARQYVFQLRRGVTVRGVVVDREGQPVFDATVRVGMLGEVHTRETRSLADGSFEVAACTPGRKPVAAEAPGFAAATIEADIDETTPPLRLVLQPGKALRFRVLDKAGSPIAGTWFALETLRAGPVEENSPGTPVPQVEFSGLADAEGRAVWEEAPDQELSFAFAKPGYLRRDEVRMRPSEQEHVVVLQPALTIAGTVSDAATAKPISDFRVLCGWPETFGDQERPRWSSLDRHQLTFSGGTFRHALEEALIGGIPNPGYVFKFEAEGYAPFVTRVFRPDEGEVEFAVTLKPSETVTVTVVLPDGQPAARGDVGFVSPGDDLTLRPGGLEARSGGAVVTTDAAGQFRLPTDETVTMIVAAHPQGFARTTRAALQAEPVLRLQAWARVEGRAWSRGKPATAKEFTLSWPQDEVPPRVRFDFESYRVVSDGRGEFEFDKVPPGELLLVELVPFEMPPPQRGTGWSVKPLETITANPGQTSYVETGKDARRVRLRLRWPGGVLSRPDERVGFASITTPAPSPPAEIRSDPQAVAAWFRRPEVRAAQPAVHRGWPLSQTPDGVWEAVDVIPGQYVVRSGLAATTGDAADRSPPRLFEGRVVVPVGGESEVVDLGEIPLQPLP